MTNDLETRLLDARNAISELDIDETAVFARGRRLVRARRSAPRPRCPWSQPASPSPRLPAAQWASPPGPQRRTVRTQAEGRGAWTVETTMDVLPHMPTGEFGPPDEPVMRISSRSHRRPGHYALRYELLEVDGIARCGRVETESGQATWGTAPSGGLIVGFIDDEVINLSVSTRPPDPDEGVNSDFMPVRSLTAQPRSSRCGTRRMPKPSPWTRSSESADGRFHQQGPRHPQVDVPDTAEPGTVLHPETGTSA